MIRQQGLGLAELLISFFLSTLLLSLLMQHVLHTRMQSRVMHASMDESRALQWTADLIRQRIRMAGFTPCRRVDHLVRVDARAEPDSLAAIEMRNTPDPRLVIHRMRDDVVVVQGVPHSDQLWIETALHSITQPVLIADCYHAEVHEVAAMTPDETGFLVTLKEPLQYTYQPPFYIGTWMTESFFTRALKTHEGHALFYQYQGIEQLTTRVHDLAVELTQKAGLTLAHVVLAGDKSRTWVVDAVVRAP